jgi:hypothetical protein
VAGGGGQREGGRAGEDQGDEDEPFQGSVGAEEGRREELDGEGRAAAMAGGSGGSGAGIRSHLDSGCLPWSGQGRGGRR